MKAIMLDRRPATAVTVPPSIDIIADSAITLPRRPVFLPDFAQEWQAVLCPAFRLSRLGKDVSVKFAQRYYDAVTVAMRLVPVDTSRSIEATRLRDGLGGVFDYCLTLGDWMEMTALDRDKPIEVAFDDISLSLRFDDLKVDEALSILTRYATIKTGDILIPCHFDPSFPVEVGRTVTATLNTRPMLTARIK